MRDKKTQSLSVEVICKLADLRTGEVDSVLASVCHDLLYSETIQTSPNFFECFRFFVINKKIQQIMEKVQEVHCPKL